MFVYRNKTVDTVLDDAKRSKRKGINAYEYYKSDLSRLTISSNEYCQACKKLARITGV